VPFFNIPLGVVSVFLSTLCTLIVTRFANASEKLSKLVKSFVDLARLFARLVLSEMRTDPLLCGLICGQFNRFSWKRSQNSLPGRRAASTYHRLRPLPQVRPVEGHRQLGGQLVRDRDVGRLGAVGAAVKKVQAAGRPPHRP
jgi:hypothetical protein